MYFKYFFYVVKHKWYVFKVCLKEKMYIHAFTHDLSKFLPSEFIPYAKYFFGNNKTETDEKLFKIAVMRHYNRNPHHLEYWVSKDVPFTLPKRYIQQLVADWVAMGWAKKPGSYKDAVQDALEFYQNNKDNFNATIWTLVQIKHSLEKHILENFKGEN